MKRQRKGTIAQLFRLRAMMSEWQPGEWYITSHQSHLFTVMNLIRKKEHPTVPWAGALSNLAEIRQIGEPLIAELIATGEEQNPALRPHHSRAWADIWVVEHLLKHGYFWDGTQFVRTPANAFYAEWHAQCSVCGLRTSQRGCGWFAGRGCPPRFYEGRLYSIEGGAAC